MTETEDSKEERRTQKKEDTKKLIGTHNEGVQKGM